MEALPLFALILVAFYLLVIRPQRSRAKLAEQLQARLAPGAEVMTTTGLFGTITEVRDDSVLLEVAPGVSLRFLKAAIGRVVTADEPAAGEATADPTATADDGDQPGSGTTAGTDTDARNGTAGG